MSKYIDAEKLKTKIRKHLIPTVVDRDYDEWEMGKDAGLQQAISIIDSLQQEQQEEKKGCGVEFPHFGAQYPDGKCINGYLWDMDSYEDGFYTIGGDDPCPICNTEEWLKDVLDDEIFKTREDALKYVEKLKSKYAYRNKPDESVSDDLDKEIDKEWKKCNPVDEGMGVESAYMHIEAFDIIARHFAEWGAIHLNARKEE